MMDTTDNRITTNDERAFALDDSVYGTFIRLWESRFCRYVLDVIECEHSEGDKAPRMRSHVSTRDHREGYQTLKLFKKGNARVWKICYCDHYDGGFDQDITESEAIRWLRARGLWTRSLREQLMML